MKIHKINFFLLFCSIFLSFSVFCQKKSSLIDNSKYFIELQKENKSIEGIIATFRSTTLEEVMNEVTTNDQKLAFWVNVYNGFIQYYLTKNPELYIDRRKFFNEKRIKIAGELLSFADIEHGIIRKSQSPLGAGYVRSIFRAKWERKLRVNKKDWRIHFVLNCGAKSCPPIAIYDPIRLDNQFDIMTFEYLTAQTIYNKQTKVAKLVSLFSLFRGDFGGKRGVRKILKEYNITPEKPKKLKFITYDWSLLLSNYREIKL